MNEPRYDEDYVNLGYFKKNTEQLITDTKSEINKRSRNFGTQPTPPYYINDTYMDGTDIYICIKSRVIGDFNNTDWKLASEYITDDYLNNKLGSLDKSVADILEDLQEQIDGTVEIWAYEGIPTLSNEPAVNWDIPTELQKHVGDVYNDMLTGDSYRFVYYDGIYQWLQITDSQAAAAYTLAQEAKNTADSKMKVFVVQPVPPYDISDLWAQGETGGLYRCKNKRASGVFNAGDWEPAVSYDETATVIRDGLITTGSLIVKQGGVYTAGITGNTSGDTAVRFWAGSDFNNRAGAPFRVTQGGKLTATGIDVTGKITATSGSFTGKITATSGTIGDWTIDTNIYSKNGSVYTTLKPGGSVAFATGSPSPSNTSGAPLQIYHDGRISATSGTVAGFTLSSTSFSGTTTGTHTMLIRRGTSAAIDLPANGGRLMLASSTGVPNVALTSAGGLGVNGLCISDSYNHTGSGETGYSIGIRAIYGHIRIVSNNTVKIESSGYGKVEVGNNVLLQPRSGYTYYVRAKDLIIGTDTESRQYIRSTTSGQARITVGNAIYLVSGSNGSNTIYAQGAGLGRSPIRTSAGASSSINIKDNVQKFNQNKYDRALNLLDAIDLYEYDYKYKRYENNHQYGFIIDYIEDIDKGEFFDFKTQPCVIENNTLNEIDEEDNISKENENYIEIKKYDSDVLDKYLLTCIKALQIKINQLEVKLNER